MSFLVRAGVIFSVSLAVSALLLPRLAGIASRIGLLDQPSKRKIHHQPKPLVGGVAMAAGVAIGSLLCLDFSHLRGFFLGFTILLLVGFLDDFRELDHRSKFIAQLLAVSCTIFMDQTRLLTLGDLLPDLTFPTGIMAVPITIIGAVGVINAVNMSDGLDGLAGSLSLIACAALAVLAYLNGQFQFMLLALAFCGALSVFLKHNWHPATLFMGDAGSLILGFALAYLGIGISQAGRGLVPPVSILLIMAVPIVDTVTVMTKRMLRKKSPFQADRTHFHHLLLRCGFTNKLSVLTIVAISSVLAATGVAGAFLGVQDDYLMAVFLGYSGCYLLFVIFATRILRAKLRLSRGRSHGAGILVSRIARLMECLDRKAKIRWEGFQFKTTTPTPCILSKSGQQVAGALKNLSAKGFSITTCESLLLGEELAAGLFVRNDGRRDKPRTLDLAINAEVIKATAGEQEFEYLFRFANLDRNATQQINRFLVRADIQPAE